jgi:hypothetical protein
MKKNYLQLSGLFLLFLLTIIGCQKEISESQVKDKAEDAEASVNTASRNNKENSCRLVSLDWSAGGAGLWQFHYNEKGLADQWKIDYGYGTIEEKMYYDKNNRLIKADEIYFGSNYEYRFYYTGKRLTRATRINVDFPEDAMDFTYTYNWKGQNIRQDDVVRDEHVLMYYDAMGNCTRTDIYLGSDLWYSDNYTFEKSIKNPLLNVPGVETGFLSYGGTYMSNKRWFTTNRTVIYDAGVPFVFNDYDPSKTIANNDRHNLPLSVNYFDRISGTSFDIVFDYENCDGRSGHQHHHHSQANKNMQANSSIPQIHPVYWGSLKSLKEQADQLRRQRLQKEQGN